MSYKKFSLLFMILSIVVIFGSCTVSSKTSTLERIQSSGKLVMGTSGDYPPFEFHMQENGQDKIVGFDVSLAEEIAKDLGVTLEIKDMDFEGLIAAITTDNIDIILAGMNATEDRKQSVDFSNVYYQAEQKIIVREEDYDKYKTADDLKNAKIGAQKGTIQEEIAQEQLPDATLRSLPKTTDLVLDLRAKNIDAVILDSVVADACVARTPGIKVGHVIFDTPDDSGFAVAIKKGNSDLAEKINATINRLISDGSLDKFMLDNTNLADE